jgi:hypothetical protein
MSALRFDSCPVQPQCENRLSGSRFTFLEEALLVEDGDSVDQEQNGFDESAEHLSINNY